MEATAARPEIDAAIWESQAVAALHLLNAQCFRAFAKADIAWYREHLSDDFVCTLPDGYRVNKTDFLRRVREEWKAVDLGYDEIDVRLLSDVALVHGVIHCQQSGKLALTRYTTIWQSRQSRWLTVGAQMTPVSAA